MKLSIFLTAVLYLSLVSSLAAAEKLDFEDETVRTNYSLGHQIGGDFKRQGVEMNAEAVVQGIRDALEGNEPQMAPAERDRLLEGWQDLFKISCRSAGFRMKDACCDEKLMGHGVRTFS